MLIFSSCASCPLWFIFIQPEYKTVEKPLLWIEDVVNPKKRFPMSRVKHGWLWAILITVCFSPLSFAQDKPSNDGTAVEKLAASLAAAKTDEERVILLTANKELVTVELQRALAKEGASFISKGEYPQALTVFHF